MSYAFDKKQYDLATTYRSESPEKLALKLSKLSLDQRQFIVNQVNGFQKSVAKFPSLSNLDFVYSSPISIEQASSEETAKYKAMHFATGKVLDLSGGMGIDSWFYAEHCEHVTHLEIGENLHQITKDNFQRLGKKNVNCVCDAAENYVSKLDDKFDLIYLDPSRRKSGKRIFEIQDCEPNILNLLPKLLEKSKNILLKTSPLLDIKSTVESLNYVQEVHIVSINNECKEVLYVLAHNKNHRPKYHAIELLKPKKYAIEFHLDEENDAHFESGTDGKYIYEPGSSVLKAGMFKLCAVKFDVKKVAANSHLYISDQLIADFPGKIWSIQQRYEKLNELKKNGLKQVNFITRNAGYSTKELYKKTRLSEGGEHFILATRDDRDKLLLFDCQRVTF